MKDGDVLLELMLIKLVNKKRTTLVSLRELKDYMGKLLHVPPEYKMEFICYMKKQEMIFPATQKGWYKIKSNHSLSV